ncbi:hypothetical protein V5094_05380 [Moellerella wisconsensis]|uniref:hypothetical protein n=1 Tax=Moellerella wisconsensis TaxID=158849 RepID=UPI003076494E
MDYSNCNFVSIREFTRHQDLKPVARVNVKTGNISLNKIVNEGLPFVLMSVDISERVIRLQMSQAEGRRVHYQAACCVIHLPKKAHGLIVSGFTSAKAKVINLEKGDDGAWYGRF